MLDPITCCEIARRDAISIRKNVYDVHALHRWIVQTGNLTDPCTRRKLRKRHIRRIHAHPRIADPGFYAWVTRGDAARLCAALQEQGRCQPSLA